MVDLLISTVPLPFPRQFIEKVGYFAHWGNIVRCNYLFKEQSLLHGIQEADGSIPFSSMFLLGFGT